MSVILRQENQEKVWQEVEIKTENFMTDVAIAEALLPRSAESGIWITLKEDKKKTPESPITAQKQGDPEVSHSDDNTNREVSKYRKELDVGRLFALSDAGWDAEKIADDMKCSKTSVYNWLKKRREGKASEYDIV